MKVVVVKYVVGQFMGFEVFVVWQWWVLEEVSCVGVELVVLLEYLFFELVVMFEFGICQDFNVLLVVLQVLQFVWLVLYIDLVCELCMIIQVGMFLIWVGLDCYCNWVWWFVLDGMCDYQDKLQLMGFEKDIGVIEGGDEFKVFDLNGVCVGIVVCYDSEFLLFV